MKILIINTAENKGGAAVACNRLHKALLENGHDSKMLVREKASDDPTVFEFSTSAFRKKINLFFFYLELLILRYFKKKGVDFSLPWFGPSLENHPLVKTADVIHIHWAQNSYLTLKTLKKLQLMGKRVVWTLHDMWAFTGGCHYNGTCRKFESSCHNCPQLKNNSLIDFSTLIFNQKKKIISGNISIVCPSHWLANEASSSSLLKNNPIEVIPYNIPLDIFKPYDKKESMNTFGLDSNKKIILFVSMNIEDERKGFHYLKESILRLESTVPNWTDNYEILAIGRHSDTKHFNTKITYTGRLSDTEMISKAYAAADVFVAPSVQDNLPNTVIESLACGTPVVAFDIGGMPDMIKHKENGYLANFANKHELDLGILYCTENDLRAKAVQFATTHFKSVDVSNRYIQCYQQNSN